MRQANKFSRSSENIAPSGVRAESFFCWRFQFVNKDKSRMNQGDERAGNFSLRWVTTGKVVSGENWADASRCFNEIEMKFTQTNELKRASIKLNKFPRRRRFCRSQKLNLPLFLSTPHVDDTNSSSLKPPKRNLLNSFMSSLSPRASKNKLSFFVCRECFLAFITIGTAHAVDITPCMEQKPDSISFLALLPTESYFRRRFGS